MGSYGQHTEGTRLYTPTDPRPGRRSKREITERAEAGWLTNERTAHNERTFTYPDGRIVVVLIGTPIVTIGPDAAWVKLDCGGWYTPTTTSHMMDALARHGILCRSIYAATRKKDEPRFKWRGLTERLSEKDELTLTKGVDYETRPTP